MPPPPPADAEPVNVWRRFVLPALFVAALFAVVFLRGRDDAPPPRTVATFTGSTMGTTYAVKVVTGPLDPKSYAAIDAAIGETLEAVNAAMSTYRKDSELSRFNAAPSTEAIPVSDPLRDVVAEALRIGELSGGAFDITVGPLVNAWGFGPDGEQNPPDDATLQALRERVGADKLVLAGGTLQKTRPDVYVDLSAIAKGHGVDRVGAAIERLGYAEYLVEIGGEVRARGHNGEDQPWRVGIEKPDSEARAVREVVALGDAALATSGDYRNYYERDGKRLSHTIDPRTGRPIEHRLASVSVVSDTCATADGLATALNVLGPDAGYVLAESRGLAALFIVRSPDGAFSERMTAPFEKIRVTPPAGDAEKE